MRKHLLPVLLAGSLAACLPEATQDTVGTPDATAQSEEVSPPPPLVQESTQTEALPAATQHTLDRLRTAANAGNAAALVAIAAENDGFAFSFGDETDFAAYLAEAQMAGRDPVADLAKILALPFVESEQDGVRTFTWPYFYPLDASAYTDEAKRDAAAIVGPEAAAQITNDLGYLGPRAAIDQNGAWIFFLTGD